MDRPPLPSVQKLRDIFTYFPKSGKIYYKAQKGNALRPPESDGDYLIEGPRGQKWLARDIIYKWMAERDPGLLGISHLDGNKGNFKWENLVRTEKLQPPEPTEEHGVKWCGVKSQWMTYLSLPGRHFKVVGWYRFRADAVEARDNAIKKRNQEKWGHASSDIDD